MNQAEDGDAVVTNMAEEKYGKMDGRRDVLWMEPMVRWFGIDLCPSLGKCYLDGVTMLFYLQDRHPLG